ncbi:wall-associated receptor kinase-like 8 [Rosa sericea]
MSRSQFQFLVLHFTSLFILWSLAALWHGLPADSIAKLHCPSHCGRIATPYPFGIGEGCYLTSTGNSPDYTYSNNSFQIICDNSSNPPKPFLSNTSLEVMEISIEGTLRVRSPITFSNCTDKLSNRQTPNLRYTPFWYSQENRFTSMSCGGIALMTELYNGSKTTLGGCLSICDYYSNSILQNNSCGGINCCQTTLPQYLDNFNASFGEVINARSDTECKYGFLVDQSWFNGTNISTIGDMDFVPVVLEWTLSEYYSNIDIYGTNNWTDNNNSTYSSEDGSQRFCSKGYQGNPYLLHGCQDIDECEDRPCGSHGTCINNSGDFDCDFPDTPPVRPVKPVKLGVIVTSSVFGVLLILICGWWSHKVIKKRKNIKRKKKFFKQNGGLLLEQQLSSGEVNVEKIKLFNSKELEKATDHFNVDRILGQGGQGTVYKGMLADGRIVAVKKSKLVHGGEVRQFINEIVILSQIIHRNVVKLLGCCLETEVPLLVYEFIANGTLSEYIHQQNKEFPLTWEIRLRVAIEVAGALSYLHSEAAFPIYHRDIKSSNILLDEKYRAKVADFGTSRSVSIDQTHLTTLVHGTFGYLDPEYFQSSQFTDKSDVYSFGVVLVELLTGQKPVSLQRSQEGRSLATYFLLSMDQNCLIDVLDPQVTKYARKEEITAVANLAKRCLNLNGKRRPTMKEVVFELESIHLSVNASNHVHQHLAEVAYIQSHEITEAWDVVSTSTGPCNDGGSSSFDAQPLLT